jgi:hypothetical protein
MKRLLALALCALIASPACATTNGVRASRAQTPAGTAPRVDARLMADYVRQLPIGSRVRVTLVDGQIVHAILMKHDADPIVVQRRTRIPEPPVEIAIRDILAVELEAKGGSAGRTIAIGAAAAAAGTLSVLMILAAIFSD